MIPKVVVVRDAGGGQTVRKVLVNGHDILVSSVTVTRSAFDVTHVTLVLPAEYIEEDS